MTRKLLLWRRTTSKHLGALLGVWVEKSVIIFYNIMQFTAGPNRLHPKATQLRKSTTTGIPDHTNKSHGQSIHASPGWSTEQNESWVVANKPYIQQGGFRREEAAPGTRRRRGSGPARGRRLPASAPSSVSCPVLTTQAAMPYAGHTEDTQPWKSSKIRFEGVFADGRPGGRRWGLELKPKQRG